MEKKRYLVRKLMLIEEGETRSLSLQYVEKDVKGFQFRAFDIERPGYVYIPALVLEKKDQVWINNNTKKI